MFALGIKAGVEPLALWNAMRQGAGGRRHTFDVVAISTYRTITIRRRLRSSSPTRMCRLPINLGRELGLPTACICNLTLAEMTEAMSRGWEGRDSRAVMLLSQERAGIKVAVEPEKIKAALAEK